MKLNLKTTGELQGGAIGYAYDQAIAEALRDLANRPNLKNARKVTLTLTLTPTQGGGLQDNGGALAGVVVQAEVKTSFPSRKGDTDVLSLEQTADDNGEPVVAANFMQIPLLSGQEN